MANPDLKMAIEMTLQAAQMIRGFQEARKANEGFTGQLQQSIRTAEESVTPYDRMRSTVVSLVAAYASFKTVKTFADNLVRNVGASQQLNTRLESLTDSTTAYQQTQTYLEQTSDRLNVSINVLSDSYSKLLALQQSGLLTTADARKVLEGYANAAAQTGASNEQLKQSMFGLTQGLSAGTLRAEELNQMTEPLPGLMQKLDKAIGGTAGSFRRMVINGEVSSDLLRTTLLTALEEYEGAAARTSGNIIPTFTRLKNAYQLFQNALEKPVVAAVIPALEHSIEVFQRFRQYAQENEGELITYGEMVGRAFVNILKVGETLLKWFLQAGKAITEFVANNGTLIKWAFGFWMALKAIFAVGQLILALHIAAFVAQIVGLGSVFTTIGVALKGLLPLFVSLIKFIAVTAVKMGALSTVVLPLMAVAGAVAAIVLAYEAWSAASKAQQEINKQLEDNRQKVKAIREEQEKLGRTVENVANLDRAQTEYARKALIERIVLLEQNKATMEAMYEADGDLEYHLGAKEAGFEIDRLREKVKVLTGVLSGEGEFAAVAQVQELRSELNKTQDQRKKLLDEQQRLEKEAAANSQYLAQQTAVRQMSEFEQVLEAARSSTKEAIKLEKKYAEEVEKIRNELTEDAISDEQKLRGIRQRMMSEQGKQNDKQMIIQDNLRASREAMEVGEYRIAKELADEAKDLAENLTSAAKAEKFFTQAMDIAREANQGLLRDAEHTQQALQDELLKKDQRFKVEADIQGADETIRLLQSKLDGLKDKTITITANLKTKLDSIDQRVASDKKRFENELISQYSFGGLFAKGGEVKGDGTATSDSILARLSNGEFVQPARAVNYYGANFMEAVRSLQLPRFATGGAVGNPGAPGALVPVSANNAPVLGVYQVELSDGKGNRATLMGEQKEARAFADMLNRAKRGSR